MLFDFFLIFVADYHTQNWKNHLFFNTLNQWSDLL